MDYGNGEAKFSALFELLAKDHKGLPHAVVSGFYCSSFLIQEVVFFGCGRHFVVLHNVHYIQHAFFFIIYIHIH